MVRKIILSVVLLLMASASYAAVSIEDEVIQYNSETPENKIAGGRKMLLEKLKNSDIQKAEQVYNFLEIGVDTNTYASFYQFEEFRLIVLLKKYDVLRSTQSLNDLLNLDRSRYVNHVVFPKEDGLYPGLNKLLMDSRENLLAEAKQTLKDDEYDFERLIIDVMLSRNKEEERRNIQQAESYLAKYPASKYNELIKKSILGIYVAGDSGFEFYFGVGPINYTGEISNYIPNYWGGNFGASYINHGISYNIDFNSNFTHYTSKQFSNGGDIWVRNLKTSISSISLNLGYKVRLSERYELCPYIGYTHQKLFVDQSEKDAGFYRSDIESDALAGGVMFDLSRPTGRLNMAGKVYRTVWRIKLQVSSVNFTPEMQGMRYGVFLCVVPSFWSVEHDKSKDKMPL